MNEKITNIFEFGNATHVDSFGWYSHTRKGTYLEQLCFLRSRATIDHAIATRMYFNAKFAWNDFRAMTRLNGLNQLLVAAGVMPEDGIYCITPIVNGKAKYTAIQDTQSKEGQSDYLYKYMTEGGLDFPKLFHDDFFEPIELLWNKKHYVACLKVLFTVIDSFGYLEFGPVGNCFGKWLDKFCNLKKCGVTSQELWELRNSLIHMSNLDSRKVERGKVERLSPQITHPNQDMVPHPDGTKAFHFARFLSVTFPLGVEKWVESFSGDIQKLISFVKRYDRIVSETRTRVVER